MEESLKPFGGLRNISKVNIKENKEAIEEESSSSDGES